MARRRLSWCNAFEIPSTCLIFVGGTPTPVAAPPEVATGRRYVGIRSMVDVQHRPLRAFEQHGLAFIQSMVQQFRRIANVAVNLFTQFQGFIHFV